MSKRQAQENQDGEKDTCVIAQSRHTRNLVALIPSRPSLLPSSSSTLQSLGNTGASCSSFGLEGTGRLASKGFEGEQRVNF